jgi:para-nitrobenzyl esterase
VIVVTINYRLGILGFLGLAALVEMDPLNLNFGLQDQQFAMQWVQNNIANFGGTQRTSKRN